MILPLAKISNLFLIPMNSTYVDSAKIEMRRNIPIRTKIENWKREIVCIRNGCMMASNVCFMTTYELILLPLSCNLFISTEFEAAKFMVII